MSESRVSKSQISKSERADSTYALRDLLTEVIEEPAQWMSEQEFIDALKVQGKFAKWQDEERGITPCSLNTLKTSAEETLDGGYNRLDQLRLNALAAIEGYSERKNGSNKRTRAGLAKRVEELEKKNKILEQQNALLVDIICNLKENAAKYAKKAPALTRAQCEKDMRGVEARISFSGNKELFKAIAERERHGEE
ncbi:hypothetical protein L4D76_01590 [Photobacterium sagamiensis]|uniref:hypothetical protein n=1 Tax=Photobacterium sagamiensis TaxID=2910241 RepID=UPI003D0D6D0B